MGVLVLVLLSVGIWKLYNSEKGSILSGLVSWDRSSTKNSDSKALDIFIEYLDKRIEKVYDLRLFEAQKRRYPNGRVDTLNSVLLDLIDIRYKRCQMMIGGCNSQKEAQDREKCLEEKISDRKAFVREMLEKHNVTIVE